VDLAAQHQKRLALDQQRVTAVFFDELRRFDGQGLGKRSEGEKNGSNEA
jgi:hypothetical protein